MIDIHMAHMPGEISRYDEIHLDMQGQNVYHIDGTKNNLMDTRRRGFSMGDSKYVSFLDPDDQLIGFPFDACIEVLERGEHSLVYTNSIRESRPELMYPEDHVWSLETHRAMKIPVHQVVVYRRDMMETALKEIFADQELVNRSKHMEMHVINAHMVRQAPAFCLADNIAYRWFNKTGNRTRKSCIRENSSFVIKYCDMLLTGVNYEDSKRNNSFNTHGRKYRTGGGF